MVAEAEARPRKGNTLPFFGSITRKLTYHEISWERITLKLKQDLGLSPPFYGEEAEYRR